MANKAENHWCKLAHCTLRRQKRQPKNYKLLMSAFILKCHEMLLMTHFDKALTDIGYHYHQDPQKTHGSGIQILWELKTIECHVTSSKQIFAIYPVSDLSKLPMSAFILKCHKMLLMTHFDKALTDLGYYYHQHLPKNTRIRHPNIVGIKDN